MDPVSHTDAPLMTPWTPRDLAAALMALALGALVGWLDLQVTEVSITIGALLSAGFVAAVFHPVAPWRWAGCIAVGLPVMAALAGPLDIRTAEQVHPDVLTTLVAAGCSLAGAYGGALLRNIIKPTMER